MLISIVYTIWNFKLDIIPLVPFIKFYIKIFVLAEDQVSITVSTSLLLGRVGAQKKPFSVVSFSLCVIAFRARSRFWSEVSHPPLMV